MTGQLESRHFFRDNDKVQHLDGRFGVVTQGHTLYAEIEWDDGGRVEVDQFDPSVVVIERAGAE